MKTVALLTVLNIFMKTIQGVITLTVFGVFSVAYLGAEMKWNTSSVLLCWLQPYT